MNKIDSEIEDVMSQYTTKCQEEYTRLINEILLKRLKGENKEYSKPVVETLLVSKNSIKNVINKFILTKKDIINMIRGVCPSYEYMCIATAMGLGHYSGSYDRWSWDDAESFDKYDVDILLALYEKIKN